MIKSYDFSFEAKMIFDEYSVESDGVIEEFNISSNEYELQSKLAEAEKSIQKISSIINRIYDLLRKYSTQDDNIKLSQRLDDVKKIEQRLKHAGLYSEGYSYGEYPDISFFQRRKFLIAKEIEKEIKDAIGGNIGISTKVNFQQGSIIAQGMITAVGTIADFGGTVAFASLIINMSRSAIETVLQRRYPQCQVAATVHFPDQLSELSNSTMTENNVQQVQNVASIDTSDLKVWVISNVVISTFVLIALLGILYLINSHLLTNTPS